MIDLHDGDDVVGVVVVEIQLRVDEDKRWTWPSYLVEALATVPPDRATEYALLVLDVLTGAAPVHLEALMSTQPYMYDNVFTRRARAEGQADGEARGEARGRAVILLRILEHRGIAVPDPARARIHACTDAGLLEAWSDRALTAGSITEVLDDPV